MELKSKFLPEFKVQQPKLTCLISSNKHDSPPVLCMFSSVFLNRIGRHFLLNTIDGNILKFTATMTKISRTWLSPRMRHRSYLNSPLTAFNLQIRSVLAFKGETLVVLLLVGLSWMKSIGFLVSMFDLKWQTAAWLRAEAHWESMSYMRHVDSYKRKYAEQEFYALKRRCFGQEGNSLNCFCLVAVKKEEKNVRRTVLNSIVGTLDLSIRQFVQGETYPEDIKRYSAVLANQEPLDTHKYAYISNVCVAKFARRQGIASNMIYLATDVAMVSGIKQLFVHVNADNGPAQDLYIKTGFKVVEAALSPLSEDHRILMSMDL